jgi:mRNA interferase MazF
MPQLRLCHGDVFIAQLDPTVGGEIRKTRPVVIVSNDAINTHSRVVVVAPVTSNVQHASPSHIIVAAGTAGLVVDSRVLTDQIRAIDRRRLVQRIGQLPVNIRDRVKTALRATLDL